MWSDAKSPLFGLGPAELDAMDAFFVVIFDGIDDVSGQKLNVRRAYRRSELRFAAMFIRIS